MMRSCSSLVGRTEGQACCSHRRTFTATREHHGCAFSRQRPSLGVEKNTCPASLKAATARSQLAAALKAVGGGDSSKSSVALAERQATGAQASTTAAVSDGQVQAPPAADYSGFIQLLFVPLLWGTYPASIRYLYSEDNPLDPATLTAIRTTLSAGALLLAAAGQELMNRMQDRQQAPPTLSQQQVQPADGKQIAPAMLDKLSSDKRLGPLLTLTFSNVWVAGLELGLLNFVGTSLQVTGLATTSATRAGFLVQLTSVLTPVVSYLAGFDIPPRVWAAVAMGVCGSCLVTWDSMEASAAASGHAAALSLSGGEALVMLSCFFFSLCTVRMGLYAPRMPIVNLAAGKKIGLSVASIGWMAASNFSQGHTAGLGSLLAFPDLSARSPVSLTVLLYSGLGPGALASFLQASGQASVPATQAQVIFSLTPLWSALFAYWALGGESMGPAAWLGGAIIMAAGIVAATAQSTSTAPAAEEGAEGTKRP